MPTRHYSPSSPSSLLPPPGAWALACVALALCLPLTGQAQYKQVGPDGKVTYTDRPPTTAAGQASPMTGGGTGGASVGTGATAPLASLPFELRQVATRYPVMLYTVAGCSDCDSARQWLQQRGIPYAEKVAGPNDGAALQKATGVRELPALTIGAQVLTGFASASWTSYLDAAGYPRESRLPASYRPAAPSPLVVPRSSPVPTAPAQATSPAPPPAVPPPTPGGIRF